MKTLGCKWLKKRHHIILPCLKLEHMEKLNTKPTNQSMDSITAKRKTKQPSRKKRRSQPQRTPKQARNQARLKWNEERRMEHAFIAEKKDIWQMIAQRKKSK